MFESLVANLLNRVLGSYIENFDPKQLNIGIWSGDVKLKNLRLKKESLDKFRLPLDVKFGHLGELTLQIPWSNLKSKPVKIIIEDVYVLASPVIIQDYDYEEEKKKELQVKKEKLEDLETLVRASLENQQIASDLNSNETFTESLVTKIVDNLQVTIKNIHIRYEDDSLLTEDPYSLGLILHELSAVSTDENWTPSFISITQNFSRKLLLLKRLSCYMNTDSTSVYNDDHDTLLENLKHSMQKENLVDTQYLLKPVSGEGRLTVHKPGTTETYPHVKTELFFEEFSVDLDSKQYRDILWTASKFHWYIKTEKFRKFRPKVSVEEDPKEWFRYTAKSILNEIHEKNYKWSWEYFAKRRDQRKTYVNLWKLKVSHKQLSADQIKEFDDLEAELPFEDIKFYRSLARNDLRKENLIQNPDSALTPKTSKPEEKQKSGGWISSWWGGSTASTEPTVTDNEKKSNLDELALSDEQRKAFYEAIEWDENQKLADSIDVPRDRVKVEILATLKKGGISVRRDKSDSNLAEVIFEGCTTQIYQRPDSLLANFQLQEFRVEDGTQKTLYKHIVSVKQLHSHDHTPSSSSASSVDNEPFFQVSFEQNPLDGTADSILLAKLKSMTIFYNPNFVEEIFKFFKPPKIHLDTVGAIMNAAEATVEGITAQTRMGLQYALEEHKTINVKLDLQAPLIILPLDPTTWKSPVAIIDAGHISVVSDLVDKSTFEEIKAKQSYSDEDWKRLNTLMYDRFSLQLHDAQFLVGPNIRSTMEQLHQSNGKQSALMLDKFNFSFTLGLSILPEATNLARFKISGDVPEIKVAINDFQYKTIMNIIDVIIPNFDDMNSEESSIFDTYGGNRLAGSIEDIEVKEVKKESKLLGATASKKQHLFEFDLFVGRTQISLSRCIDGVTLYAEPFVDLVGDALKLNFYKADNDMHLDLLLKDINLIDHIEKSGIPEFEKLISSNNFIENENQGEKRDLFQMDYERTQRIVEFNGKEIEVFDQDISMNIATVKLVVSRKSILSILNFVLNTFTDPNAEATPADELKHNDSKDEVTGPQKINVNVNLDSIIMVLNEDSIKLATFQLSTANIKVFLVPEAMEVTGKLGALSLHDESNEGSPRDSLLRKLVSMEGDNLAEFTYKTFDNETNKEPFNTLLEFKTGSTTISFIEDAFSKILNYLSQFQRMKEIYDRARDAAINQASQIDYANKIKFNFLLKAPTIVFPKLVDASQNKFDTMTANLGELYASNEFIENCNVIEAGLRNIRLSSKYHFDELLQVSELVEGLDISFKVDYAEDYVEGKPTFVVDGKMPELEMHLTELQLKNLLSISDSVTKVFTTDEELDDRLDDIKADAKNANAVVRHNTERDKPQNEEQEDPVVNEAPSNIPSDHRKVQMKFAVPKVALKLYNRTDQLEKFDFKIISSFNLNNFDFAFDMNEDGNYVSDVSIKSFVVNDERLGTSNKFSEMIPPVNHENSQFILNATTDGEPDKRNTTVMLTVDSPKMILALDYIFEVQNFVNRGLESDPPLVELSDEEEEEEEVQEEEHEEESEEDMSATSSKVLIVKEDAPQANPLRVGFSINITNPTLMLLADPSNENTEAIVFKMEQVLITSQNVTSVAANNIGMFVTIMNSPEDKRLRIIDDFSISFAHDSRDSDVNKYLTNIQLSIEPLLMRVSLRDIRLALEIFNRATELYSAAQGNLKKTGEDEYNFSEDFKKRLSQYAPTIRSNFSEISQKSKQVSNVTQVIIKGEEFFTSFGGARFVLIGDVHELPVLDMNLKPFEARAINWSTDLSAETHIECYVNIYNYSRSTWEPLVEPWPISIYASRQMNPDSILVDIISRELAQISVSSRSIALLSRVFSSLTSDELYKSREEATPYRITNETGYDLEVWIDNDSQKDDKTIIKNHDTVPFSFEDWREIRENLDTDNKVDILALRMIGSNYDVVNGLSATGEGEELVMLQPPVDGVHDRLSCEITLGTDNVKTIWLKSTIKVENDADISIAVSINEGRDIIIESKKSKALPIGSVYLDSFKIKPVLETKYDWSEEALYWHDLLEGGTSLTCPATSPNDKSIYYFQAEAVYDKDEPLSKIYPHMSLVISAPLEVENLLPFDINFRLYDKSSRKDWSGNIKKGVKSYVHLVSLSSLLLLSVEPVDCGFSKSEFAIINIDSKSEFKREQTMSLRNEDGQVLKLRIHYPRKQSDSTSLKVVIYSPYVILNRTGRNVIISERGNQLHSIGRKTNIEGVAPNLFSFEKYGDRKNRALLKTGDSTWSPPISFDAIGQATAVRVQVHGKQTEINIGVSILEGEGKYNLSKVVTLAPRYIVISKLNEPLEIIENGSTKQFEILPNELKPLYGLRNTELKSLMLRFPHSTKSNWSSPFAIDDIGQVYLKAYKENVGQVLLKVSILTENGTLFIQIDNANNEWPFSIRNFSDNEFYIYQGDPNVNENGDVVKDDTNYKPIFYRVPPKSVMPYAYDYPNAIIKELVIRSHGRERAVNLAEIGNLKPFRLPMTEDSEQAIVDLNVVADGPTQSLIISNYDPSVSLYKLQSNKSGSKASVLRFEAVENDENYYTKVVTRFEGFGISLINARGHELCYTTLRGLEIRYNESDLYQNLSVKLKWIQIDNQLYGGIFPIVVYPSVVPKSGKEMNNHPSFSGSICKVKDDSHGVLFIKYATVLLQEMTIEIDEDFLFALLEFSNIPGAVWHDKSQDKLCDDNLQLPEPKVFSESSDIYFEALHLQPTLTNLSFVRTERINAEDRQSSQNTLMFFFNVLTMAIGNINDAPIKLNALFIENIRVPIPVLIESIETHYGQSFFYQVHKILGSADFIGNPVGLFKNLSSGVLDIFYEPYQGFVINDRPQELGIGLAKGGLSFLKKSIFGFSDSISKVTGSIAKGLSVVTLDKKFQERRRLNQRRNKPKHALYGFASGANSFFESISSGVTGIATNPIEGANEDGASGFFRGLGKGFVGLPTKTAIGLFDFASNVSEGIRNTTTVFDAEGLDKVRLPRFIAHDLVVRPYSQREAQGQFWLMSVDGGVLFNESYLAHLVLSGEENAIIVTFKKIILFQINTLTSKWQIAFDQIRAISIEPTGISIKLKKREGPFIPIPEKQNRSFLYNKISIAVQEYNKHCQVIL